jgi:hypothetical protein
MSDRLLLGVAPSPWGDHVTDAEYEAATSIEEAK